MGTIILIIIPALCKEKGSPFGAPDVCQTYGLAYSSLSKAVRLITHTLFFSTLSTSGKPDHVCLWRKAILCITICHTIDFLQIGSFFLWTGTYNIIRAYSEVTEVEGNTPTTQTKVSVSDSTIGAVSEENYSIPSDHVDECTLPLICNPTTARTKVSQILEVFFY
jgi:hypothetical protein